MVKHLPALLGAGVALAGLEFCGALVWGSHLFLGSWELLAYACAAFSAIPALVIAVGVLVGYAVRPDRLGLRVRVALALVALGGSALTGVLLTEGRRVRELSLRPLIIAGIALAGALAVVLLLRTATYVRARAEPRLRLGWSVGCAVACALLLALDLRVLPRSYPAFHAALFVSALLFAGLAAVVWEGTVRPAVSRVCLLFSSACVLSGPFFVGAVARKPNASYAVTQVAPWSAKLLAPALKRMARPAPGAAAVSEEFAGSGQAQGIDLRDRDVLLITVDALRADVLSAIGRPGIAPELDALSAESVVFRRAYTPAPHTSYALASLLTAKFMKQVLELPGAEADHPTLPDLLRRYGYRTAAFYPPAIFFVDAARFEALRERGFGFEYRKEMFASADQRVTQLEQYLDEVTPGHPLFVWVHLFEPHEPYDPPAAFVREDSARGRYDGEVRVCDRAIGELVRRFRARRPGATVIVTADHGEEFGEHGGSFHGTTLFDEQVRVPLLWSSPGLAKARAVDTPVELTDVGTTLLSAAGIPREARMRGDDLGPVLSGAEDRVTSFAFASVETQHMATDGKLKVICDGEHGHCALFDLESDPGERRNLAEKRANDVARLRGAIDAFFASIPRAEALAFRDGAGFPEALARAKLGAPGVGPEVVPLLGDPRAAVRAAAARVLGELQVASALPMLDRARSQDSDPEVRAEAAIAALALGADAAADQVVTLLAAAEDEEQASRARRAALALARVARAEALPQLAQLALDDKAQEAERLRAIAGLGALQTPQGVDPLIALLDDVRLRTAAAEALGELGGKRAADALAKQLQGERYPAARRAEARALVRLQDRRAVALIRKLLGMETSLPDGVRLLMELGELAPASARGAVIADGAVRRGTWDCSDAGCVPGEDAELSLPARNRVAGAVRVTWLVHAGSEGGALIVADAQFSLKPGEQQVSFVAPRASDAASFAPRVQGDVRLIALAVTPVEPEIPPPPPEPWEEDAGAPAEPVN